MRIAILHSRIDGKGGTQRQALNTALAMQALGHTVTVYTLAYRKEHAYTEVLDQLRVVSVPYDRPEGKPAKWYIPGFLRYVLYIKYQNELARAMARAITQDTDVLNSYDRLGFRAASYYKTHAKPIPSVIMMDDILTRLWAFWRQKQFNPSLMMPLKRRILFWLVDHYEIRKFFRPHERMVVLDERTKQWAKQFFGVDASVVRSGLDVERFAFHPRTIHAQGTVRLFATGVFFLHRRYEDIIHAVRTLCDEGYDASLTIAGDHHSPDYRGYHKQLTALVRTLGLEERVSFPGIISEEDLREHYRTSCFYISSNHLQSWGLATFEAMASGLPVVVSKTAGASEVLTDGETALLVNPASPQEIADAVKRCVADPILYEKLSRQGRAFVEEHITWKKTARELVEIFKQLR